LSFEAALHETSGLTVVRTISFIIPAHNQEQLLWRTLAALHAAARAVGVPYEIIVVDASLR